MNAERLTCRCGVEVRIVRLNDRLTALGHVTNPRQNHHPVTLARDGVGLAPSGNEDIRRHRREREAPHLTTNGTRSASKGRSRTAPALGASPSSGITKRLIARLHGYPDPAACWTNVMKPNAQGYGQITANGRNWKLHRLAYETWVGPIPAGLTIDHLCRNRQCANPGHLEPVTLAENTRRGFAPSAVNGRKTRCIRDHELPGPGSNGRRQCQTCDRLRPSRQRRSAHGRRMEQGSPRPSSPSAMSAGRST